MATACCLPVCILARFSVCPSALWVMQFYFSEGLTYARHTSTKHIRSCPAPKLVNRIFSVVQQKKKNPSLTIGLMGNVVLFLAWASLIPTPCHFQYRGPELPSCAEGVVQTGGPPSQPRNAAALSDYKRGLCLGWPGAVDGLDGCASCGGGPSELRW